MVLRHPADRAHTSELQTDLVRIQTRYDRIAREQPESDRKDRILRRLAEREDWFLARLQEAEQREAF